MSQISVKSIFICLILIPVYVNGVLNYLLENTDEAELLESVSILTKMKMFREPIRNTSLRNNAIEIYLKHKDRAERNSANYYLRVNKDSYLRNLINKIMNKCDKFLKFVIDHKIVDYDKIVGYAKEIMDIDREGLNFYLKLITTIISPSDNLSTTYFFQRRTAALQWSKEQSNVGILTPQAFAYGLFRSIMKAMTYGYSTMIIAQAYIGKGKLKHSRQTFDKLKRKTMELRTQFVLDSEKFPFDAYWTRNGPGDDQKLFKVIHYIDCRRIESDLNDSRIITGLRFKVIHKVLYIQIRETKIVSGSIVNVTGKWKEIDLLPKTSPHIYRVSTRHNEIMLRPLVFEPGLCLTGIRLAMEDDVFGFDIKGTSLESIIKQTNPSQNSYWEYHNQHMLSERKRKLIRMSSILKQAFKSSFDGGSVATIPEGFPLSAVGLVIRFHDGNPFISLKIAPYRFPKANQTNVNYIYATIIKRN